MDKLRLGQDLLTEAHSWPHFMARGAFGARYQLRSQARSTDCSLRLAFMDDGRYARKATSSGHSLGVA